MSITNSDDSRITFTSQNAELEKRMDILLKHYSILIEDGGINVSVAENTHNGTRIEPRPGFTIEGILTNSGSYGDAHLTSISRVRGGICFSIKEDDKRYNYRLYLTPQK